MSHSEIPIIIHATPLLVPANTACHMLGEISHTLLRSLTEQQIIPSIAINGRTLYPVRGLQDWVSNGCPISLPMHSRGNTEGGVA